MHYLIYGTGAVGGYLGGLLNLKGIQTTFLARPRIASTLQESGLQVQGKSIQGHLPNPQVFISADEALNQSPPDVILLTVKAYDVEKAAAQIQKFAAKPIPIVCFTNGVGSETNLLNILPQHVILPATTTTAVQMQENGVVRIERKRGIGLAGSHPILTTIARDLSHSGMRVRRYKNPERMKWSKLLTNIISNATSAIIGWSPERVFNHPGLYRLEVEALRETVRVMRSMGIKPQNLPKVPVALLSLGIFFPPSITKGILGRIVSKGRGSKRPSFHYDIGRGRSEISWLNGAVVREGEKSGIPTPSNKVLTETMLELTQNASEYEQYRDHPTELLIQASKAGVPGFQGYNP